METFDVKKTDSRKRAWFPVFRAGLLASLTMVITIITILTLAELYTGVGRDTGRGIISSLSTSASQESRCRTGGRALVYNKSPKTASSFIQTVLVNWTEEVGRPLYQCYRAPMFTLANIQSCLPEKPDPCGVFSCHVYLEPYTSQLFRQYFPNHLLATSTRYPGHRMVSMFLFSRKMRDDDPRVPLRLSRFLETWNPWKLYNYHTGESRTGSCPLNDDEKRDIFSVVSRFHVVIDANSMNASNAILKHHKLFTMPVIRKVEDREKERGATRVNMTEDLLELLRSKVCVEEQLHRAFQIRMARLYEEATGEECMFDATMPIPDTCIEREERETLKDYWRV